MQRPEKECLADKHPPDCCKNGQIGKHCQQNVDEYNSEGNAILKKQNSDDSGFREPIDDNNSITGPNDHQPRHPKGDPFKSESEFLL